MRVKLIVLEGAAPGREIPLPSTVFVIGRATDCHLRTTSRLVSKMHCAISRKTRHVVVRDLDSRNSTYINEQPIANWARAQDGDILGVGPLRFRFDIQSDDAPTAVQVVLPDDVRWLLDSASDFAAPYPLQSTIALDAADPPPPEPHVRLTAGQHLRDYLRRLFGWGN